MVESNNEMKCQIVRLDIPTLSLWLKRDIQEITIIIKQYIYRKNSSLKISDMDLR